MSKFVRKTTLGVLSLLFALCVSFFGINAGFWANAEDNPNVVNLTFNTVGLNGGENNDNTFGGTNYYTCIRFTTGVFSGDSNGVYDFSDLTEKASYVGSGNTDGQWGFAPAYTKWSQGYKNDAVFNFIYLWTANKPATGDTVAMKSGSYFAFSGTFADGTGACNDKYVLAEDINLKFNGTAWEYYVPIVEPEYATVNLTFSSLGLNGGENNDGTIVSGKYLTAVRFTTGVLSGSTDAETAVYDYSNLIENTTYGGDNEWGFAPSATKWSAGYKNDAVFNFLYFYTANQPAQGDTVTMKANSYFIMQGTMADGTPCNDKYVLVEDINLKFNGTAWELYNPNEQPPVIEPTETVSVKLTGANGVWNNFDYTEQGYFCTFLHFEGGIGGGGLDGDFSDLLSKVTLNGQPVDTENVSFVCAKWIGWENGILLRFKTLPEENSILVFPAGATFTVGGEDANVYEISETVELKMKNGKWNTPLPTAELVGVNEWNNNIVTLSGSRLTILDFNVDSLGNVASAENNLIAMAGITVNGVKLTDIDGASVTYAHGFNHMAIDLPMAAIYPTEAYPITVMKIAQGTVFENYELPEITLSLIGGTWVVGEFEFMPEEGEYVTISDIAGEDRVSLGAEGLLSAMDGFEGDVNFKFVYRSDEAIVNYAPFGGLVVYLNSTNSWDGWRIFFVGNVVYVYDATMGGVGDEHVLLGQAQFGIASSFEMQIEISIKQVDGKYSIVIGGSCAKILEINDITPIGECIGGGISLYSAMRSCSVKDYKYGDVFDPVLTIHSKQEIVVNEGDAVPEIDATAVDGLTEITPTYVWDEGAITDGKMNAGVWNCVVTATDANGNYATATVRVTVKGEPKYTVTFDGKSESEYTYGEKIVKPTDPTKESTAKVQYTFDGWYNGDEKWDFDYDIVTEDVALVAKFIESDVYYKVGVTISGETQTVYVTYGAQVDLSVFDKEGYKKEIKQNGKVITSLIVTEDTAIEIVYTKTVKETPKRGCSGSVSGVGGLGATLAKMAGCMLMRKKEEKDEK